MAPRVLAAVFMAIAIIGLIMLLALWLQPGIVNSTFLGSLPILGGLLVVLFSFVLLRRTTDAALADGGRFLEGASWLVLVVLADTGAIVTGTMTSDTAIKWLSMLVLPLMITPLVLLQVGRIVRNRG